MNPIENHRQMKVQYGDACLSLQEVYKWTRKFMNGIRLVTDYPRPGARVAAFSAKRNFSKVLMLFPKRWNTCMRANVDYIEKLSHCVPFVFNKLRDKNMCIYVFKVFI